LARTSSAESFSVGKMGQPFSNDAFKVKLTKRTNDGSRGPAPQRPRDESIYD